jgi:hypothetical protein
MGGQQPRLKFVVVLFIFICVAGEGYAQEGRLPDIWAPFRFVLGDWVGAGSGAPGEGVGVFSFKPKLGGKILVRKSRADYPPKPGEKNGISHEDLLIVYPMNEGRTYRAVYFDNEGHIIHYAVAFQAGQSSLAFESEGSTKEARYRLGYEKNPDAELVMTFSIAPPGRPFKVYLTGTARHQP